MVAKKKKVHHRKKKEENPTYVKVENALTLRKELLGTAIDVTTLLKRWESYKMAREMKLREIKALHSLMKEMEKEFKKLKSTLPKVPIEKQEEDPVVKEDKGTPVKDKGLSAIDQEIQEIKYKLSQIDL